MKKFIILIFLLLFASLRVNAQVPIFQLKYAYLFPKISVSKGFETKNDYNFSLSFGESFELFQEVGSDCIDDDSEEISRYEYEKIDFQVLKIDFPINGKNNSEYYKKINYALIDFKFNVSSPVRKDTTSAPIGELFFRLLNRNNNSITGINEINYLNISPSITYAFYSKENFRFLKLGFGAIIGASRFELNNFGNAPLKKYAGFDWGFKSDISANNKFAEIDAFAKIRKTSSLWIYTLSSSIAYKYQIPFYIREIDGFKSGLYDVLKIGINYEHSVYKQSDAKKTVNELKLNFDVYLFNFLMPSYLKKYEK